MGLALLLALGFAVYWTFLVLMTVRALTRPPRRSFAWSVARGQPDTPGAISPPREFVQDSFPDPRNRPHQIPFWRIPGDRPDGPVVIFSHGWGESKQSVLARLAALAAGAREVIAWDMPGHGEAPPGRVLLGAGEAAALGELLLLAQGEDLEALEREAERLEREQEDEADWEAFFNRPPLEGAPEVVLYGYSLGAGVSLRVAADCPRRVAGVVAESPYRLPATPARGVLRLKGLPHAMNLRPALALVGLVSDCGPRWSGFDRAEIAREVRCPLLVVHGVEDAVCPIEDGREIASAAARGEIEEIEGAGHADLWSAPESRERVDGVVRAFLGSLGGGAPGGR